MNTVTINTVQGIGDIFWVYQKLAPYFDRINVNVLCTNLGAISIRAKEFCTMLPKVGAVAYLQVAASAYKRVAEKRYQLAEVIGVQEANYAVNAPLEVGVNLRDIDPDANVDEFVDLGLPSRVEQSDYLCVFVAGSNSTASWAPALWVDAIRKVAQRLGTRRVALVGAEWDRNVQDTIGAALRNKGYEVTNHVGLGLADSINVIRRSRFFLGYQSGLNVIAENYDVPQLMLYFNHLRPMMFTWCKRANVKRQFHAATFGDDIDRVIAGLPL